MVLTGEISSSSKHVVSAPQGSRWQVQIQWMEEEGTVVQKGAPVVVFDGAIEQAQLTQNQENLDRIELEYEQLKLEQEQALINARGVLKIAKMQVEKARIEASVPAGQVSAYDKGLFELALQSAMLEQVKAEEALNRAIKQSQALLTKKEIEILETKEQIAYLNDVLQRFNVIAQVTGPVSYAIHPWTNQKLSAGMSVRPSWKVLDVQSIDNFQVETWVHEIDAVDLQENQTVTVILDAYPSMSFDATLTQMSTQSERKPQWSKSAYFPAIITFNDLPQVNLLPGMSARIIAKQSTENDTALLNTTKLLEVGNE